MPDKIIARRNFMVAALSLAGGRFALRSEALAQSGAELVPKVETLEAGDLLWPKTKDGYIPYSSRPYSSRDDVSLERQQWEHEQQEIVRALAAKPERSPHEQALLASLQRLSFAEFHARYVAGHEAETRLVPHGAAVGVGHVALVTSSPAGERHVVEAMPPFGVRRIAFADWLAERPGQIVFHGRLRAVAPAARSRVAAEAELLVGRPYSFWSFDLADDSSFYCSKLIWLSVLRAIGAPPDGNPEPKRSFWLSPKQLLNSDRIEVLFSPGPY